MENAALPQIGSIYQFRHEVRQVVGIYERENRDPDIIFLNPEKGRNSIQWLPLWIDWVSNAVLVSN